MEFRNIEQMLSDFIKTSDELLVVFNRSNKSPTYDIGRILDEDLSPQSQEAYAYLAKVGSFFEGLKFNAQEKVEKTRQGVALDQMKKVITSAVAVMAKAPYPFAAYMAGTDYVYSKLYRFAEKIQQWKFLHTTFVGACVEHAYDADLLRAVLNIFEPDEKPFVPLPQRDAQAFGITPG
jgi:hypothetical protein